ncbi:MAG TPA: hypothetical protein VGB08_10220 [Allosphingosinicella sp.]|jgi:hypothetical protein
MRWNKREKVERPEYPKLIPVAGTVEEAHSVLPVIQALDPDAAILDGGERGAFLKVHNAEAEAAATAEDRIFPLA